MGRGPAAGEAAPDGRGEGRMGSPDEVTLGEEEQLPGCSREGRGKGKSLLGGWGRALMSSCGREVMASFLAVGRPA